MVPGKPPLACYTLPRYKAAIIVVLAVLTLVAAFFYDFGWRVVAQVALAIVLYGVLDGVLIKLRQKGLWNFPSGGMISAMIVANIINPGDFKWTAIVVLVTLGLKHAIKPGYRNIFNPAVLGIVVSTLVWPGRVASSWWASSPALLTFVLGLALVFFIKKAWTALSFYVPFQLLSLAYEALQGKLAFSPDVLGGPIAYFAFFMVIEPVTTPSTTRACIMFGLSVAVLAFVLKFVQPLFFNSFFLYLPLLFMNLLMRALPKRYLS